MATDCSLNRVLGLQSLLADSMERIAGLQRQLCNAEFEVAQAASIREQLEELTTWMMQETGITSRDLINTTLAKRIADEKQKINWRRNHTYTKGSES